MVKKFCAILLILSSILVSAVYSSTVFAQQATISGQPNEATSSFELFWPLSAGRTEGDSLYGLKLLKEQIRGWFIFKEAPKADYQVMLSTKRILEADKLLQGNKTDQTVKTLDQALINLRDARLNIASAQDAGDNFSAIKENLTKQLLNLEAFIPRLIGGTSGDIQKRLEKVKENVEQFLEELR